MRIMGLDFGSKTVGVAVSDELLLTAQGLEIIRRKEENKQRQTLARIEELIVEYGVTEIVLGYPKNMCRRQKSSKRNWREERGFLLCSGMSALQRLRRISL